MRDFKIFVFQNFYLSVIVSEWEMDFFVDLMIFSFL